MASTSWIYPNYTYTNRCYCPCFQERFLEYAREGFTVNYANILVLLTRLRQACVHPFLAQSPGQTAAPEGDDQGADQEEEAPPVQGVPPRCP